MKVRERALLNRVRPLPLAGQVDNTGQGGFGYLTGARDPRIMQLALKFLF
jgi:hypothetical protein